MNDSRKRQSGFSLIELLIAAAIFAFVVTGVTGLFLQALDLQRRASGIQKIQENALYVLESISREVRVSTIPGAANCAPDPATGANELVIQHPVNGTVTYQYTRAGNVGVITRNGDPITSSDVDVTAFAFYVYGGCADKEQTRVTIPMTIQSTVGNTANRVSVSLQTTVVSRDLSVDFSQ